MEKNTSRRCASILSNLYKIDDRTIKYKQAQTELLKMTNGYLAKHFEVQGNSRDLISKIEEMEWLNNHKTRKNVLKDYNNQL